MVVSIQYFTNLFSVGKPTEANILLAPIKRAAISRRKLIESL